MYKLLSILALLGLLASSLAQGGSLESNSKQVKSPNNHGKTYSKNIENREGCGWRNSDGIGFQIGGITDEAKYGEFPWTVAILKIEPANQSKPSSQQLVYIGGGSLIHPSVVLTAAHHVSNVSSSRQRVRAGEWDTQTEKELYPHQDRDVKEMVVHKDFNKGNLFYDIALLFLASPVDLAPNVGVACLPKPSANAAAGTRCLASGWPKDSRMGDQYQALMKRVEATVVDRVRCQQELRQTRLGSIFELHSSFMCAGAQEDDKCQVGAVAGGSPLVCPAQYEQNRYIQHGIVAWGIGCGPETPVVYVDVGRLRSWVDDKVRGHGYEEKVYSYLD